MRKLEIAALALLFGWCVNLPTSANAAPAFPHALVADAPHTHIQLAQYGGGNNNDDDDDRPAARPAPQYNGGYNNNNNYNNNRGNRGGINAGDMINIMRGVGSLIQQEQMRKQMEQQQRYNQQQQRRRNSADAARRAREKKEQARFREQQHQRALEDQREKAAKDDELKQLKEQVEDQKKQHEIEEATHQEDSKYPESDSDNVVEEKVHDTEIKIHPSRPGMPDPSNLPSLVVGPVMIPACGYVNLPPNRNLCGGSTDGGAWLRIVTVPTSGGGSSQACVQFSRECKPRLVMIPKPPQPQPTPAPPPRYVTPNPVPPPVACNYPPCAPTPVPPPTCTGPSCGEQEQRNAVCTNPPCIVPPVVTPKPVPVPPPACTGPSCGEQEHRNMACTNPPCITPSVVTPKPTYPPVKTAKAETVFQKEEEKPVYPPVKTAKAETVFQKEEEKPVYPPVKTAKAITVVQEESKHVEPPVVTDKAVTVVQKEEKKLVTPPTQTDKAKKVVQKEAEEKRVTPPVKTAKAEKVVEDEHKNHPRKTDASHPKNEGGEIDEAVSFNQPPVNPPAARDCMSLISPVRYPNFNFSNWRSDPDYQKCLADKKIADEKKKEDDDNHYAMEHPVPDNNGKSCTVDGDKPIASLLKDPDYRGLLKILSGPPTFQAPDIATVRGVVTSGLGGIPSAVTAELPIGPIVGGLVSFLWKDTTNDELFTQLKKYVDTVVPDSITNERVKQLGNQLSAVKFDLRQYAHGTGNGEPGGNLNILLAALNPLRVGVLDPDTPPEKILALIIAVGTLHTQTLREKYIRDKELYGPKANMANDRKQYNCAVDAYKKAANDARDQIIKSRLAMLRTDDKRACSRWSRYRRGGCDHEYWAVDDFCDWSGPHHSRDEEDQAGQDLVARTEQVRKVYNRDLDELLKPIASLASITPMAQPADDKGRPVPDPADAIPCDSP
jgi:hypothetical protein